MTPEDIKKIAEEYAKGENGIGKFDYLGDEYEAYIDGFEDALQFLTERFYLVEKGKVEEKYRTWVNGLKLLPESQVHTSVVATLNSLFGPDIRKEEDI